jgi:hypothetical protein
VGTPIAVTGTTTCPDNPGGPDIELFFWFARNFSGGGPDMDFEVDDGGAFSGTFIAPDPSDPAWEEEGTPLERNPDGVFAVPATCTDANGDTNSGDLFDGGDYPEFTYTQAPGTTSSTISPGGGGTDEGLPQAQPAAPQRTQPTFTG